MGSHSFLQGIFLTQGSNPCLLHLLLWQADYLPLYHLRSPDGCVNSRSPEFFPGIGGDLWHHSRDFTGLTLGIQWLLSLRCSEYPWSHSTWGNVPPSLVASPTVAPGAHLTWAQGWGTDRSSRSRCCWHNPGVDPGEGRGS